MLLCAGLGRRMLPLTLTLPKPAIPVLGRPLAMQLLHRLARHGIDRAVVNLHHLPEILPALLGADEPGLPEVHFTHEEVIRGTAGGLALAAPLLRGDGPILVHNSDFLSDIDVRAVAAVHARSGRAATLVLVRERPGYSRVDVDAEGRVISLAGLPEVEPDRVAASYVFTGCHIIDEDVLDLIPDTVPSGIVTHVYGDLAAAGRLGAYVHHGFWSEFGTPTQYLDGSLRMLDLPTEARIEVAPHDAVRHDRLGCAAVGCGAQIHPGARLEGRNALGFASLVGEGVTLRDCVVMPEAWIGPGSRLERVVVGPRTEIPAGFVGNSLLIAENPGGDRELPDDVRVDGGLLVRRLDESNA